MPTLKATPRTVILNEPSGDVKDLIDEATTNHPQITQIAQITF